MGSKEHKSFLFEVQTSATILPFASVKREEKDISKQVETTHRRNQEIRIEDPSNDVYSAHRTEPKQANDNFPTSPEGFETSQFLRSNEDYQDKQNSSNEMRKEVFFL